MLHGGHKDGKLSAAQSKPGNATAQGCKHSAPRSVRATHCSATAGSTSSPAFTRYSCSRSAHSASACAFSSAEILVSAQCSDVSRTLQLIQTNHGADICNGAHTSFASCSANVLTSPDVSSEMKCTWSSDSATQVQRVCCTANTCSLNTAGCLQTTAQDDPNVNAAKVTELRFGRLNVQSTEQMFRKLQIFHV